MTYKKFFSVSTWLALTGIGGTLMVLAASHLYLSPTLPSVDSLRDIRLQTPLRIYSNDGKLIGEIGEKRRTPVKFEDIPQGYIDALLSAEDAQFYSHHGVSIKGLMRASSQLLISGDIQGGGSTITMQVARNFFLSKRQEFTRKFNEILLALRIERELSKQEILELYVNVIFLGNRAYGIQAAAQVYYGTTLDQLTLPQLAMIAGMPKAPSTMNPLANPQRALQRRDWILQRMYELNKIDEAQYESARSAPITAKYHGSSLDLNASYVAEMARAKAVELFGTKAYTDGYRIYTTIDSELQTAAQQAVVNGLLAYDERHGFRGPERTLPVPESLASDGSSDRSDKPGEPSSTLTPDIIRSWHSTVRESLADIPIYAGLLPAAVIEVHEKSVDLLTKKGEKMTLGWEQGLSSASPYLSVNSRGAKPERASDVLKLGDVVRISKDQSDLWQLRQLPEAQAALVSLNPRNGAVLALVGGLDFQQSNFNRAVQARRQPGSAFKAFLYTAALENGFTAASVINDAPIVFDDAQLESAWRPENAGGNFYGPTRLRKALYLSRNLVSIRVLKSVGINNALKNIDRFGLDPDALPRDLSLALGTHVMSPFELATGYAVLANGGYKVEPYFIERILNFDGKPVYEALPATVCRECDNDTLAANPGANNESIEEMNLPFNFHGDAFEISRETKALMGALEPEDYPRAPRVIDEQVAYIMDSMLKDVVKRGTATKARALKRNDLAGKTGTTNSAADAWFSGYGGDIVTTTWIGFDEGGTLGRREYGGTAALPIWMEYMQTALASRPEVTQPRPPGLVTVRINPTTGKRANIDDNNAIFEIFRSDNVPPMDNESDNLRTPWEDADNITTDDIF